MLLNDSSILITGGAGFLGWNLIHCLSTRLRIIAFYHRSEPDPSLDVAWIQLSLDGRRIGDELAALNPRAIIHCAAVSTVAQCDENRTLAFQVNVEATRRLAEYAEQRGACFMFISTDLVFDGTKGNYTEEDEAHPVSWYAETKHRAEEAVANICANYYIIRTALMYGAHGHGAGSFLRWTLDRLKRNEPLNLYVNQFRNPLFAPDLAAVIEAILEKMPAPGIYHAGGPARYNRSDIGKLVADVYGFSEGNICAVELQRPVELMPIDDTTLVTDKIRAATGMIFTYLRTGLQKLASGDG